MIAGRIRRMTDADTGIVVWDREQERQRVGGGFCPDPDGAGDSGVLRVPDGIF